MKLYCFSIGIIFSMIFTIINSHFFLLSHFFVVNRNYKEYREYSITMLSYCCCLLKTKTTGPSLQQTKREKKVKILFIDDC